MEHMPRPQEIYRHFKGNLYQVIAVAEHSETGEQLVVYQAMYGEFRIYARPLVMFTEKLDRMKYPGAAQEHRFEAVRKESGQEAGLEANPASGLECSPEENPASGLEPTPTPDSEPENVPEQEPAGGEPNLDPMLLEFLDASTYAERLNILAGLHYRITDDMINVMAMATDIEVKPGNVEERYAELRNCLHTLEKFECNRLR